MTDIVQVQGKWKLHIHEGKGLKDRVIPLTSQYLDALHVWQNEGWEGPMIFFSPAMDVPWRNGNNIGRVIRELGRKLALTS